LEGGAEGVFGANVGSYPVQWPGDVECGIVPEDAAFAWWVIEIGGLVEDLGGIGKDNETVSEAFGNP